MCFALLTFRGPYTPKIYFRHPSPANRLGRNCDFPFCLLGKLGHVCSLFADPCRGTEVCFGPLLDTLCILSPSPAQIRRRRPCLVPPPPPPRSLQTRHCQPSLLTTSCSTQAFLRVILYSLCSRKQDARICLRYKLAIKDLFF